MIHVGSLMFRFKHLKAMTQITF
jgi:LPS O-antigen subunit length determinant protein (WzzB/FepE family)